jgi:hypothetical protein
MTKATKATKIFHYTQVFCSYILIERIFPVRFQKGWGINIFQNLKKMKNSFKRQERGFYTDHRIILYFPFQSDMKKINRNGFTF